MGIEPTRCFSSQLTGKLMEFRNPQGTEDQWLLKKESADWAIVRLGKVFTAQCGVALLVVSSVIEAIAFSILFLVTLPTLIFTKKVITSLGNLTSSAGFTIYWNLANFFVHNPFCKNIPTNESFARFVMDNWAPSKIFRIAAGVAVIGGTALGIIYSLNVAPLAIPLISYLSNPRSRSEDSKYIAGWGSKQHHPFKDTSKLNYSEDLANDLILHGHIIKKGTTFFIDNIINEVDETTRKLILENKGDSHLLNFILTRATYLFVLGDHHNKPIPDFFGSYMNRSIIELREKFENDPVLSEKIRKELSPIMGSLDAYDLFIKNISNEENKELGKEFKALQDACFYESNELLVKECLQAAVIERNSQIRLPIPQNWENDPILSQFKCSVSNQPIREITTNHDSSKIYDKTNILKWINETPMGPHIKSGMVQEFIFNILKIRTVQGLIDFRIKQLEQREKELGRALTSPSDDAWIKQSALELDQTIEKLLTTPIEELTEIPEFLSYGLYLSERCNLTGKLIRHISFPDFSDEVLKENPDLMKIAYEASELNKFLSSNPGKLPPNWPIEHCPLPTIVKQNLSDRIRQDALDKILKSAIDNLRKCYKYSSLGASPASVALEQLEKKQAAA